MFYSQGILAKKESPLSKIWLAAHWSKKLTKQDVFNADIEKGADAIMKPMDKGKHIPMALRVSGHLLVGLCRIYQRKVKYLFHDCSDALTKIKLASTQGTVNVDMAPAGGAVDIDVKGFGENFERI